MSYYLRKNGVQVAVSGGWNPALFGKHTGTSFPDSVPPGWSWEHAGWFITWEDDPVIPPTPDQLLSKAKANRQEAVNQIVVTTAAGNSFDGNEDAQNRMARAIRALGSLNSRLLAGVQVTLPPGAENLYQIVEGEYRMLWVLADNSAAFVSAAEIEEAMTLSGIEQTRLWIAPYI